MGAVFYFKQKTANEMEALIARSVLEAHHIPAVVLRDDAGGMLPAMHFVYPVRLAVRVGDCAHALRILDAPFEGDAYIDDLLDPDDAAGHP